MENGTAAWLQFQDACAALTSYTAEELSADQAADARQTLEGLDVTLRELLEDTNFLRRNSSIRGNPPDVEQTNGPQGCPQDFDAPNLGLRKGSGENFANVTLLLTASSESNGLIPKPDSGNPASEQAPRSDSSLPLLPIQSLLASRLAWVRAAGWFSFGLCIDAGLHPNLQSVSPSRVTKILVAAIDGVGGDLECHEALSLVRKLIASGVDLPKALLNAVVALASVSGTGCLDAASPETGPGQAVETVEPTAVQRLTPEAFDDWEKQEPARKVSRESSFGVKHASRNGSPSGGRSEEGSRSRGGSGLSAVSYASDTSASETERSTSSSRADTDVVRNGSTDGVPLTNRASHSGSTGPGQISPSEGTDSSQSRHWSAWSDTNGKWSEENDSRSRNASVKCSATGGWSESEAVSEGGAARSRKGSVNNQGGQRSPAVSRSKPGSFQSKPPETQLDTEISQGSARGNATSKAAETHNVWGAQNRPEEKPPGPKWEAIGLLIALLSTGHKGALLVAQNRGLSALLRGLQECPENGEALRLTISAAVALILSDPACRKAASQGPSSALAPLVSPFLDAAIETKRNSGDKGAERELERNLRASGEALLAVARSWSGLFLLGEMRGGKGAEKRERNGGRVEKERNGGTAEKERNGGTAEMERNRSPLGDLVVALRVTKSQLVKASILAIFASLVFQTSPFQTFLLNPSQIPLGTYLSVVLCALHAAGLPSALHDLALQTDSGPTDNGRPENGRQKAAENGHAALRLLCHVEKLSTALVPRALRGGAETAVDFVGDVISRTGTGLLSPELTDKELPKEISLRLLETGPRSVNEKASSRPGSKFSTLVLKTEEGYDSRMQKTRGLRSAHSLSAHYRPPMKPFDEAFETASFSGLEGIGVEATISTLESTRLPSPAGIPVPEWDAEDRETLLKASGVVDKRSKEWLTWDWDVIRTIVSGPLRTGPGKFFHGTKFLKRLTGFFAKRLPGLSPGDEPGRCLDVGRELVAALLETDDGCAFLSGRGSKKSKQECLLLEALAGGLRAELAHAGRDAKPIFSRDNLRKTLAPQFLAMMLTSLTGNERGILLLDKAGVLASVKALLSGNGSFSFQRLLLQLINFGPDGDQRQLLTAAMTNPHSAGARSFAATHAARLLRARFEAARPAAAAAPFERWLVQRLLTQLSDGDASVRKRASDALESGCAGLRGFTEVLVSLVPRVEELLVEGDALVLAVLASDAGFAFLKDSRWFSATWQSWTTDDSSGGAAAYARLAERAIVQSLLRQTPNPSSAQTSLRDPDFNPGFEGVCSEESSLPRHFLGALAASAQGLEVLRSCHVLQIAASKLLDSAAGELDRRGAAWSLGHVAARGGAAAGHVIETGGLANLERGVRGAVGNLGLRGTILQALTLAASSPGVRTWLSERKWVTQTDEDEEKSDVEKDSRALYGSLFDGSKGAAVGTSESGPERWDSDSTVESLGGFLKEPIPDAETETAFYDQLFGVSKSKEIPAVPAESRSTHSETKALVGIDDASGQPGFAVQGGEERVEKMELPACICLPKSPSILFTLPSDRTLDCASHYRATLRRATNKERSRVAKVFPEEGSEGDPSIEAPHATVATTSGVAKGEQIKPSRDGESAFPNIGAPAEGGTLTELPSSTESAASASGTESPAPDGAAPRASGAEPSSAAADGTASETLVTTAAMTGSDQRTSGTGSSGNGMEQRPSGTGAGAADEASEVRAERKALALLNGLCNPVTAAESRAALDELLEGLPLLSDGIPFRTAARTLLDEYHFPRAVRLAIHETGRGRPYWP